LIFLTRDQAIVSRIAPLVASEGRSASHAAIETNPARKCWKTGASAS